MRVSEILERFRVEQIGLQPCNALEINKLRFQPRNAFESSFRTSFFMFRNT